MELRASEKMVVYQVMTRLFGNSNTTNKVYGSLEENGVGKFNDFTEKALGEIRDLGHTHIWYTGVIEHAVLTDYTAYGIDLDDADVVKGRAGSPYAIKDYYDVNPDLAVSVEDRMAEFEALIRRTNEAGLKVIIDFVPNHVARKYDSDATPDGKAVFGENDDTTLAFSAQNNFYYLPGQPFEVPEGYVSLSLAHDFPTKDGFFDENPAKATGNDVFKAQPSVDDWFETIKLNYGVDIQGGGTKHFDPIPPTWTMMLDVLLYWAEKGVDGFRCDMAEMVPVEFWEWALKKVKEVYPDVIFIAEIYNPAEYRNYINQGGFDYLYDKVQLYDSLRLIIQDKSSTDHIAVVQESLKDIAPKLLHFLENHDEQRLASPFFAGDARKGLPGLVVSALIDQGPMMIYFGQEVGEHGAGYSGFSGDDGRTTIFDYWGVPEHQKWMNGGQFEGGLSDEQEALRAYYSKVLNIARTSEAIVSGEWEDLNHYNRNQNHENYSDRIYAFMRHTDKEQLIIVCNFNAEHSENIKIDILSGLLDKIGLTNGTSVLLNDLLEEKARVWEVGEPIALEVQPLQSFVFRISEP